jgi:predicted DNA-binding transcriptional regulator AlpA
MPQNDRKHWVTVSEAALLLHKSERTIWRWVDKERLPIDRSVTPHLVDVSDEDIDVNVDTSTTSQDDRGPIIDRLRAENEKLRATNERLLERLDAKDAIIERMERENDRLWETHRADQVNIHELTQVAKGKPSIWERLLPWTRQDEDSE